MSTEVTNVSDTNISLLYWSPFAEVGHSSDSREGETQRIIKIKFLWRLKFAIRSTVWRFAVVKTQSDILDFITPMAQCTYAAQPCVGASLVNVCFEIKDLKYAPQFYGIRRFTTVFITKSHWSQRRNRLMQSTASQSTSRSILILSSHLCPWFWVASFLTL